MYPLICTGTERAFAAKLGYMGAVLAILVSDPIRPICTFTTVCRPQSQRGAQCVRAVRCIERETEASENRTVLAEFGVHAARRAQQGK